MRKEQNLIIILFPHLTRLNYGHSLILMYGIKDRMNQQAIFVGDVRKLSERCSFK